MHVHSVSRVAALALLSLAGLAAGIQVGPRRPGEAPVALLVQRRQKAASEPASAAPAADAGKQAVTTTPAPVAEAVKQLEDAVGFRPYKPVSSTLYCIMALTVECMMVFTLLALAKSAEEASGKLNPSIFTETLATAARSTAYPPMLCVLFVAGRMFTLVAPNSPEPPVWVKTSEVVATLGMTFQFLVVFMLPLASEQRTEDGLRLSELSGEPNDIHPMLWAHKFHSNGVRSLVYGVQLVSMVCIYFGVVGVIAGILLSPDGDMGLIGSVSCTVLLSILYFGVYLALWILRTHSEIRAPLEPRLKAARCASLAASMVVRKVPMYAAIFLAARIRAMRLDPPNGTPPMWAQVVFFGIVASVYLETLAAAYVGATGTEDEERSHFGSYHFSAAMWAHAAQHLFALLTFVGLIPVLVCVVEMRSKSGVPEPLSSTLKAVLQFAALFLFVHMAQSMANCYQDLRRTAAPKLQSALLSASHAVSICPLLAILFVAIRMRALQISSTGSPQVWAQNCMFLCVFANLAQFLCSMMLPLLGGDVDEEGEPVYDHGIWRAYAVTVVKYVALLCMHCGVCATCAAVFTMTPENTRAGDEKSMKESEGVYAALLVGVGVTLIALVLSGGKVIGLAVKHGIEAVDEHILGVDITVERVAIDLCHGVVTIGDLVVHNPKERPERWTSKYLLKVDCVHFDMNVWRLIKTAGGVFEVESVKLEGVEVCYDLPALGQKSNVQEVIDFLTNLAEDIQQVVPVAAAPPSQGAPSSAPAPPPPPPPKPAAKGKDPEVVVQEVSICNNKASAYVAGLLVKLELEDIKYPDFASKFDQNKGAVLGDIVKVIMMTILKTVLANKKVVGQTVMAAGRSIMKRMGTDSGKDQSPRSPLARSPLTAK